MAEPILHKSPLKRSKKNNPKPKKPTPATASSGRQKPEEAFIPISREELFQLHDVADALQLLNDLEQEAPQLRLVQAGIVIRKASTCAWTLIHEILDDRWQTQNPDTDLVRKY
jgi:hypothetical protein